MLQEYNLPAQSDLRDQEWWNHHHRSQAQQTALWRNEANGNTFSSGALLGEYILQKARQVDLHTTQGHAELANDSEVTYGRDHQTFEMGQRL